jgi:uncharacterized protein YcfL
LYKRVNCWFFSFWFFQDSFVLLIRLLWVAANRYAQHYENQNIMKNLQLLTILLFALTSCSSNQNNNQALIGENDSANIFLSAFQDISVDTLHVFSQFDAAQNAKFQGKEIDKLFYHYFTFDENLTYNLKENNGPIYSCYKFKLSDTKTGLLIRTPSQYDVTAIDLFVWDNATKRIESKETLSDGFGDEGWYFVQDAWITDLNRDGQLDILKRKRDHDEDLDDSTKVTNTDSIFIFLAKDYKFQKSTLQIDKSKFQLKHWPE